MHYRRKWVVPIGFEVVMFGSIKNHSWHLGDQDIYQETSG
jgi:hypothetical protein